MKNILGLFCAVFLLCSCDAEPEVSHLASTNWEERSVSAVPGDSLEAGRTYLSIYSQIYSRTQHQMHGLTATASIRNTNERDTIYVTRAEYFDEKGISVRSYLDRPIYIAPLETVEIVIDERDREGGAGAKFLFDWQIQPGSLEPLIEGVMISTSGQQGLSFITLGTRIQ